MGPQDQTETIAFLRRLSAQNAAGPAEVIETHISLVFLVGDRVFKLKRAVRLPYVDFSTVALRLSACDKELALNRRTAPALYLGLRRITREADGTLAFDGAGELVDAVVEMARFDQSRLFDRMAVAGELTPALMTRLARTIALFHEGAPVVPGDGASNIAHVLDINEAAFATCRIFEPGAMARLNHSFREALARHAALLDRRAAAGHVRRCHGDLHLRNICLIGDRPTLFDCIEFDEALASVDTLYDLAFLLMDLWHRELPGFANLVMNRYLDETGDEGGFPLLPFFMALRAAVRAHVLAGQARDEACANAAAARSYFTLAETLLRPVPARLVAIGGLSGSGKTTVAELTAPALGAAPGARIIESDRVRKHMFGADAETRLGRDAYSPAVSQEVYRILAERAREHLAAGGTALVDAVFDDPGRRAQIEEAARATGQPFTGIWLDVAPEILRSRVRDRRGGPSDATVDVLDQQLRKVMGAMGWNRLPAARPAHETAEAVIALASIPAAG